MEANETPALSLRKPAIEIFPKSDSFPFERMGRGFSDQLIVPKIFMLFPIVSILFSGNPHYMFPFISA